nr:PucR family transcriptional regulator [Rhodococcus sp. (in: high G+C Gram-positive bacteria)]
MSLSTVNEWPAGSLTKTQPRVITACSESMTVGDLSRDLIPATVPVTSWRTRRVRWIEDFERFELVGHARPATLALMELRDIPDDVQIHRQLVRELAYADAAGLVVRCDQPLAQLAPEIVRCATKANLPVFETCTGAFLEDVISLVHASNASSEARTLARTAAAQRGLLDALNNDDPETALIARLAKECRASVMLVHGSKIVSSQGIMPAGDITGHLQGLPPTFVEWHTEHEHISAIPVKRSQAQRSWLVAVKRTTNADDHLLRSVMVIGAQLISATRMIAAAASRHDQGVRRAVLKSLINGKSETELEIATETAAELGVVLADGVHLVRFSPRRATADPQSTCLERLTDLLNAFDTNCLVWRRGRDVLLAAPSGTLDALSGLLRQSEGWGNLVVVVSEPVDTIEEFRRAVRELNTAVVTQLERSAPDRSTSAFFVYLRDLSLVGLAMSAVDPADIRGRAQAMLAPILENPILEEAVDAFFEFKMDIPKSSEALHIHTNTMRYRLERVEKALGGSLRDPMIIANLVLARIAHTENSL